MPISFGIVIFIMDINFIWFHHEIFQHQPSSKAWTRAHFTNDFSVIIHIRQKIGLVYLHVGYHITTIKTEVTFGDDAIDQDDVIKWKHFPRYWPFVRGTAQRPVTRSFDVFCDLRLNKRLSKQLWGRWFETLWRPLWRHCNVQTRVNFKILHMPRLGSSCRAMCNHFTTI